MGDAAGTITVTGSSCQSRCKASQAVLMQVEVLPGADHEDAPRHLGLHRGLGPLGPLMGQDPCHQVRSLLLKSACGHLQRHIPETHLLRAGGATPDSGTLDCSAGCRRQLPRSCTQGLQLRFSSGADTFQGCWSSHCSQGQGQVRLQVKGLPVALSCCLCLPSQVPYHTMQLYFASP